MWMSDFRNYIISEKFALNLIVCWSALYNIIEFIWKPTKLFILDIKKIKFNTNETNLYSVWKLYGML